MFRTAELGRKVSKAEYQKRQRALRPALLEAQNALRHADFPVIVLFGGVDGAGKGDAVNALNAWMDPRWLVTRAFDRPTQEEEERPEYWRFWRDLPPRGRIGLLLSAWYSKPLLRRAYGGSEAEFEEALIGICAGQERDIRFAYRDDLPNEQRAGTRDHFRVTAREVHERDLPALSGTISADVSDAEAVARAFEELDNLMGGLDVLINNAGIEPLRTAGARTDL